MKTPHGAARTQRRQIAQDRACTLTDAEIKNILANQAAIAACNEYCQALTRILRMRTETP